MLKKVNEGIKIIKILEIQKEQVNIKENQKNLRNKKCSQWYKKLTDRINFIDTIKELVR